MATRSKDNRSFSGKFARTLLGATCLTAATGGAAVAGTFTYTEGLSGQPSDWGNTFGTLSTVLGSPNPGTTILNGSLTQPGDQHDWIEITGLGTGTFTLSAIME